MPEIDQLMAALSLLALLLYLAPAAFRLDISAERRWWFQLAAILALGTAMAIAVVASVKWFIR